MSAQENKKIMQRVMDAFARGDSRPFIEAMADDIAWTILGEGPWSRTWRGKKAVRQELLAPLSAQFDGIYTNQASRIIAEDDIVVVECRGKVRTKRGQDYNNAYCWVCRLAGGKLVELREYMDTALVARVLEPPPAANAD
jgi:ketosteroid isomerase-like protein